MLSVVRGFTVNDLCLCAHDLIYFTTDLTPLLNMSLLELIFVASDQDLHSFPLQFFDVFFFK